MLLLVTLVVTKVKDTKSENEIRNMLLSLLKEAVPSKGKEYIIIVVIDKETCENSWEVLAMSEELSPPPRFASAEIRVAKRENPTIKYTRWALERRGLEQGKRPECNEVILADEQKNLYEGLSSNFAIVLNDYTIVTAPEGMVLKGTMMNVVIDIAHRLGIRIRYDLPTINMLFGECKAAFITSTSRLLLPLSRIFAPDGKEIRLGSLDDPVVLRLQDGLKSAMFEKSIRIT